MEFFDLSFALPTSHPPLHNAQPTNGDLCSLKMALCCIGGVCIPWEVVPLLLLCLKWVVDRLAAAGLLPAALSEKLGAYTGGTTEKGADCCTDAATKPVEMSHIYDEDAWNKLLKESKLIVAKATAAWCKPCKEIQPAFGRLAGKYAESATFCTLDVDECDEIASGYSVSMMPTFLVINAEDGTVMDRYSGSHEPALASFLAKNLASKK